MSVCKYKRGDFCAIRTLKTDVYCIQGPCPDEKPMTNADRYFRQATDEELAEWIAKHMFCAECMFFSDDDGTCNYDQRYGKGCSGAMLEWLKQEVDE